MLIIHQSCYFSVLNNIFIYLVTYKLTKLRSLHLIIINFYINNNQNRRRMSRNLRKLQDEQVQIQQEKFQLQNFHIDEEPIFVRESSIVSNLSQKQIHQDIKKCKQLIQSLFDMQIKTKENIDQINALIEENKTLSNGIGFFAAKNMIFLEYLMLIKVYQLFKINGKSLLTGNGLELYKRLAYLKTLSLKLAPVEKKLQYQKNKILKNAQKAVILKQKKQQSDEQEIEDENDEQDHQKQDQQQNNIQDQQEEQMNFKPRPASLHRIKQQKDQKRLRNDKYQAPKISSNLSKDQKVKQRFEKQKQRRKLALIRRLQSDLVTGDNAQQQYVGDQVSEKLKRKFQQKTQYQQEAFVRIPDSKKDKYYRKQMIRNSMRKNQLEEDFKEVQMVRKLFDQENQMGKKIIHEKRKQKAIHQEKKDRRELNQGNRKKQFKGKTKQIGKQ